MSGAEQVLPAEPRSFCAGVRRAIAVVHRAPLLRAPDPRGPPAGFDRLPKSGGVFGYPNREESAHDPIENAHVSAALSCADGRAGADDHLGRRDSPLRESASRGGSSATAGHTRSRGMRSHQPPGVNPHFPPRCAGATRLFAESGGRTPSKPTRHDSVPEACRT
ncbi:1-deoxy-D-xylulose-5-phosphate synthase N-terminal domain-containing protein [Streptomyces sp. NPDC088258]|uniref:1-deoxy-D-xylulose-5-phosphate synthase N-terminal domain-containing protein n=1 Tax=Streptomyces sp. NPDC088258 TaxID=3365849 RepID=UPI0037F8D74A